MRKLSTTILLAAISLLVVAGINEAKSGKSSSRVVAEKAVVKVSSYKFEPKTLTVKAGTTVQWVNEGGRHTVEADDGSFKSEILPNGGTFEHTFAKPGSYPYHCTFHGESGGKDMAGKIVVTK